MESVKITHGALDEDGVGRKVLRGVIAPDSLHLLQSGEYQREILPLATITALVKAFQEGSVPDVELGMRGERNTERGGVFYLADPVFIVDGLQRVTAAIKHLQEGGKQPHLGAAIYFSTTEDIERERFRVLNAERMKLSPNILLRNMRHGYPAVAAVHQLTTTDKAFVARDRICWQQQMRREHILSALTLMHLHGHIASATRTHLAEVVESVSKAYQKVGHGTFIANAKTFFDFLEASWGVKSIAFKENVTHIRTTFLACVAQLLSRHEDFWRGEKLMIEADLQRKLKLFPLADPTVKGLAAGSGKARSVLYQLLLEHINAGKRTRRLKLRPEFRRDEEAEREAVAEVVEPATTKTGAES